MILAERFLLLSVDDESGRAPLAWMDIPLAGALLIDLVRSGAVVEEDGKLAARGGDPGHALLAEARDTIAASSRPRTARHWVDRLRMKLRPLRVRVAGPLVERGVLSQEGRRFLGVIGVKNFRETDPAPRRELRARLAAVLLGDAEPTDDEACLVALLVASEKVKWVVPRDARREAGNRAKEIAGRGPASETLVKAIQAARTDGIAAGLAGAGT